MVPIVFKSIAILLNFYNTYCNTFEILQYLLFLQCLLQNIQNFQYLLQYVRNFAIILTFYNTTRNTLKMLDYFCNTVICSDTHYVALILRSTYSNILIRSNTCSSTIYFNTISNLMYLICLI